MHTPEGHHVVHQCSYYQSHPFPLVGLKRNVVMCQKQARKKTGSQQTQTHNTLVVENAPLQHSSSLGASATAAASPEHEIHQLKPFSSEEAVPIGWQHQAGTESIEEVLHHLLLLSCGRVVTFEHLRGKEKERAFRKDTGEGMLLLHENKGMRVLFSTLMIKANNHNLTKNTRQIHRTIKRTEREQGGKNKVLVNDKV